MKEIPKSEALHKMASQYPDLDIRAVEAMLWIFRLSGELERALEIHLTRWGISRGRFLVLIALYKAENHELNPSTLAEEIDVTRGNMTGLVDNLEKDGLIRRESNDKDRRRYTVILTKKGAKFLEKLLPDHFKRIANTFKKLGAKDQENLVSLLQKLESGLDFIRSH